MREHRHEFRVRYSEVDQLGTYFNSHVLTWFEIGRTELSRAIGLPYREWEKRGVHLPVVESWIKFAARAGYDDLLAVTASIELVGHVRVKFPTRLEFAETGRLIAHGYTLHALTDKQGKVIRAPDWIHELIG